MSPPVMAFDIETIPDAAALRSRYELSAGIPDEEAVEMALRLRRQEKGSDFLPPHFHRVAVISCAIRYYDGKHEQPLAVMSLRPDGVAEDAGEDEKEATLVKAFFNAIEKGMPRLVSWNGRGFDMPVLHWRAMKHGIAAPAYWRTDGDFRWNNYTSRYHDRHVDLMDDLALHQSRAWARLDDVARLCGLPGKMGIGGDKVWPAWREGRREEIARYCETDALLTYLLYVRFQHFRGALNSVEEEYTLVRECLAEPRWKEFLDAWRQSSQS